MGASVYHNMFNFIIRNSRVRQHLGVRYDAIPNVFDWDCSITLQDRQVGCSLGGINFILNELTMIACYF